MKVAEIIHAVLVFKKIQECYPSDEISVVIDAILKTLNELHENEKGCRVNTFYFKPCGDITINQYSLWPNGGTEIDNYEKYPKITPCEGLLND